MGQNRLIVDCYTLNQSFPTWGSGALNGSQGDTKGPKLMKGIGKGKTYFLFSFSNCSCNFRFVLLKLEILSPVHANRKYFKLNNKEKRNYHVRTDSSLYEFNR